MSDKPVPSEPLPAPPDSSREQRICALNKYADYLDCWYKCVPTKHEVPPRRHPARPMLRRELNHLRWVRWWALACFLALAATAGAAMYAAAHYQPNPVDAALGMLSEMEATTPGDPALSALRARLERHRP